MSAWPLASGTRSIALPSWLLACVIALVVCGWALAARAQEVLPIPPLSARVIDQTATLDASQQAALDAKLADFETRKGSQIAVLLVPTTQPEDISSYTNRVANAWKIGRRDVGDGVLLVLAKNDRTLRIEVAKTLEGALPDLAAKRIIEQAITPRLRQGDFAGGISAGVDQIMARVAGEALPKPEPKASLGGARGASFERMDLLIFMVFALPIATGIARSIFGRKLGALVTGAGVGVLAMVLTTSLVLAGIAGLVALVFALLSGFSSAGRGRGWGSGMGGIGAGRGGGGGLRSGGGGGFSSGGGGDFGGGGASGRW